MPTSVPEAHLAEKLRKSDAAILRQKNKHHSQKHKLKQVDFVMNSTNIIHDIHAYRNFRRNGLNQSEIYEIPNLFLTYRMLEDVETLFRGRLCILIFEILNKICSPKDYVFFISVEN
jgi:hypothetical protein